MNLGNSTLFKDFARPVLAPRQTTGPAVLEMLTARISNVTQDSFAITLDGRVSTKPMSVVGFGELDMTFEGGRLGRLLLPSVRTGATGDARVTVRERQVNIVDGRVFRAFIQSLVTDKDRCMRLENGRCTVTHLGVASRHVVDSISVDVCLAVGTTWDRL